MLGGLLCLQKRSKLTRIAKCTRFPNILGFLGILRFLGILGFLGILATRSHPFILGVMELSQMYRWRSHLFTFSPFHLFTFTILSPLQTFT